MEKNFIDEVNINQDAEESLKICLYDDAIHRMVWTAVAVSNLLYTSSNLGETWGRGKAVVVAQLGEWLFPSPEDPGSNLDIIIFMKNMELLLTI